MGGMASGIPDPSLGGGRPVSPLLNSGGRNSQAAGTAAEIQGFFDMLGLGYAPGAFAGGPGSGDSDASGGGQRRAQTRETPGGGSQYGGGSGGIPDGGAPSAGAAVRIINRPTRAAHTASRVADSNEPDRYARSRPPPRSTTAAQVMRSSVLEKAARAGMYGPTPVDTNAKVPLLQWLRENPNARGSWESASHLRGGSGPPSSV